MKKKIFKKSFYSFLFFNIEISFWVIYFISKDLKIYLWMLNKSTKKSLGQDRTRVIIQKIISVQWILGPMNPNNSLYTIYLLKFSYVKRPTDRILRPGLGIDLGRFGPGFRSGINIWHFWPPFGLV